MNFDIKTSILIFEYKSINQDFWKVNSLINNSIATKVYEEIPVIVTLVVVTAYLFYMF